MNLSRKRKKELRKLQDTANQLWAHQQDLAGDAAELAREASRQLGNFGREQVVPTVQHAYESRVAPVVDRSVKVGREFVDHRVVPVVGGAIGTALSAWDAANNTRHRINTTGVQRAFARAVEPVQPQKKGIGAGGVIAIVLGAAAAIGVLYAAWQTLRADDELWVADDPLSAPDA
jgi:hypothetical protein